MRNTLNRKYLMQAIDASLERLQMDFVDVVYCHRSDPNTPMEETVWAMSDMVSSGKTLYWGTSEWSADEIRHAIAIAQQHHLHAPVTEQSQYNLWSAAKSSGNISGFMTKRAMEIRFGVRLHQGCSPASTEMESLRTRALRFRVTSGFVLE